jgi:hypothetical protein
MEFSRLGSVIALIGMILLLMANLNRRAARRRKVWTKTDVAIQRWATLVAYALIAIGLLLLLGRK